MISGDTPAKPLSTVSVVPLVPVWRLDRSFDYVVPEALEGAVGVGSLVRVRLGHRNVRGIVTEAGAERAAADLEPLLALVVEPPLAPGPVGRLCEWLARRYTTPRGAAYARVVPPRVRVRPAAPAALRGGPRAARILAYRGGRALIDAVASGRSGAWCLQRAPGDDDGELIAELVAAAATASRAALVAVPEVRYGSRVIERLERHWDELARVDSSRSEADRARAWLRLAAGHGGGAGGRAAVLAPSPRLGLVVVDEEHHPAHKDDRSPRFDARRAALRRAALQGAACVLVSPTPSLEWYGPSALSLVEPERSVRRTARPVVELVEPPRDRAIGHELHSRIAGALRQGERVGLLAPSRGYARAVWCASCRASLRCPVCEAGLFYDRGQSRVRCGRCGHVSPSPSSCPRCGSDELRLLGAGSERLAEQLGRAFPRAVVGRADPESLEEGGATRDCDIYVATWTGTKPELRPAVSLVGVVGADHLIRRPDYRAAESAYQALAAMAEWAGPASRGGRLLVQTEEPGHYAVQAVARADHRYFVERELEQRRELGYPPFSELIQLTSSGPGAEALAQQAAAVCRAEGARVLGPIPRPPNRRTRELQMLVKCFEGAETVAVALRPLLAGGGDGSRVRVDVDPR